MTSLPAWRRLSSGVLADRQFRVLWIAQAVSLTGSAVTQVVLPLLMYQRTRSPAATSVLAATEAIPYVVFGPVAGVVADRVRRRPFLVRQVMTELAEGLRFLWDDTIIRALVAVSLALSVAGGGVFGLLVVYATRGLGLPAHSALIGLFYSAAALGGLGAAVYASVLGRRAGPVRAALLALAASPVLLAAVATAHLVIAALALVAAWAITYSGVTISAITARQVRIPSRLQGRVNTTARLLGWGIGWPAGAAIAGVLAGPIGVRGAYLLAAAVLALVAVLAWVSPLRNANAGSRQRR